MFSGNYTKYMCTSIRTCNTPVNGASFIVLLLLLFSIISVPNNIILRLFFHTCPRRFRIIMTSYCVRTGTQTAQMFATSARRQWRFFEDHHEAVECITHEKIVLIVFFKRGNWNEIALHVRGTYGSYSPSTKAHTTEQARIHGGGLGVQTPLP